MERGKHSASAFLPKETYSHRNQRNGRTYRWERSLFFFIFIWFFSIETKTFFNFKMRRNCVLIMCRLNLPDDVLFVSDRLIRILLKIFDDYVEDRNWVRTYFSSYFFGHLPLKSTYRKPSHINHCDNKWNAQKALC